MAVKAYFMNTKSGLGRSCTNKNVILKLIPKYLYLMLLNKEKHKMIKYHQTMQKEKNVLYG